MEDEKTWDLYIEWHGRGLAIGYRSATKLPPRSISVTMHFTRCYSQKVRGGRHEEARPLSAGGRKDHLVMT